MIFVDRIQRVLGMILVEGIDERLADGCHRRSPPYTTDWDALPIAHAQRAMLFDLFEGIGPTGPRHVSLF
jgi:hypothetical protein